ncbi:MAG: Calx-beta domain-containing protein [Chloroflexota bacterium]
MFTSQNKGLITLFCLVFIAASWCLVAHDSALGAEVTYYVNTGSGTVGSDGNITITSTGSSYTVTGGSTNQNRGLASVTPPTSTTRTRISESSTNTRTKQEYYRAYTPVYSAGTVIAANTAVRADYYMRSTGNGVTAIADIFEYSDATGIVGQAKGTCQQQGNAGTSSVQSMSCTLDNPDFPVAAGNRVVVIFYFTTNNTRPAYLVAGAMSGTPSGTGSFTLSEGSAAPPAGAISFASAGYGVNEVGGAVSLTVSRIGGSSGAVAISYSTSDGSATSPGDYTAVSGTLSWANGEVVDKTITIPISTDTTLEPNETFTISLTNPTGGATIGTTPSATVTITDAAQVPAGNYLMFGLVFLAILGYGALKHHTRNPA